MRDHTKLRAFELADEVVLLIYELTDHFPTKEIYGLTAQIRRAAISIVSNIVEGCARNSQNEYVHFLEIAYGSLKEAGYQLNLAIRLGYIAEQNSKVCSLIKAMRQ
ncbi:MAG: four helix bundle protein [Verrucomicrobia bacterium]|nr:four helix bundle protein [Verrucomicrobiota bacterium]